MASLRKPLAIAICVVGLYGAGIAAERPAKQLTTRYKDQVLSLRHPMMSQNQEYELDGRPVNPAREGPWTLFGRIQIKEIAADNKGLHVKGNRILYEFTKKGSQPIKDKQKVKVTLRLNSALASEDEAVAALGRVFALTPEDIVNSAPDFWQDFLRKDMLGGPGPARQVRTTDPPKVRMTDPPKKEDQPKKDLSQESGRKDEPTTAAASSGETKVADTKDKVFNLGQPSVTGPKPLYMPEPEFSEAARKSRYQGVVGMNVIIDSEGRVVKPRIVHPLGLGLDEQAIEAVSKWKFKPGTRDGQPVSVAVYIETDFHLY
jgi:TonB family protein